MHFVSSVFCVRVSSADPQTVRQRTRRNSYFLEPKIGLSLVVAQQSESGPRIVSDTRVQFLDGKKSSYKTDTLKTIVISPTLALSFSGDVEIALDMVRSVAEVIDTGGSVEDMIPKLAAATSYPDRSVQFIVSHSSPDIGLIKIEDGLVERDLKTTWIGDKQGFECFQSSRLSQDSFRTEVHSTLPPAARLLSIMRTAMRAVVDDSSVPSVGDFCVSVAPDEGEFTYLASVFIYVGRDFSVSPGENIISRMIQPVHTGGYAVSIVEPEQPGTPAMALNFPTARLGMLYQPLVFDESQIIKDVSQNDFVEVVYKQFGVKLKEPSIRSSKST